MKVTVIKARPSVSIELTGREAAILQRLLTDEKWPLDSEQDAVLDALWDELHTAGVSSV